MGRSTSKQAGKAVAAGDVWAVPVTGMGYCPLVVARAPGPRAEVDFAFAYLRPVLTQGPPDAAAVPPLPEWGEAWIGLVSTRPMGKGRWTRCGTLPLFDRERWPVPPSRASAVDESRPVEEWGSLRSRELWSVETTTDEPTMLVIDNTPATRGEALRFPSTGAVNAGSSLERALLKHFKGRRAGFWEMSLELHAVSGSLLALWSEHAAGPRARWRGTPPGWWPAGRATDRKLRAGLWLGFPVTGGGFGAAMLVSRPPKQFRVFADAVVMSMRRRWDRWPTICELRGLTPEDGAAIDQTSMFVVRDGRWRVIGEHPGFDQREWVWPIPWWQREEDRAKSQVSVDVGGPRNLAVPIDRRVLALDPFAGERCRGSASYRNIERNVRAVLDGTAYGVDDSAGFRHAYVTPERLRAWRAINAAIIKETGLRLE